MSGNTGSRVSVAWQLDAQLGEGPVWIEREQAVYFVDIRGGNVHRWCLASNERTSLHVGGMPSFIVPCRTGELAVGSQHGVHALSDGRLGRLIASVPQSPGDRTNDATVDATGRLWFGTMDTLEASPSGAVWCLEGGALHRTEATAIVTNGPAVDDDRQLLYYVDTFERTIWKCPLDAHPRLRDREVFLRLEAAAGYPDGIVVDSEGCLWVALWDGWGVRRYAPDGTLLQTVSLPCARVTKLAFGGPGLRTAFVTTARFGLDAASLARQPLAGSLFTFDAPVAGRWLPEVRLPPAGAGA